MSVTSSVPAKIILFGEHAVLRYGKCLAVAITKFGRVKDYAIKNGIVLKDKEGNVCDLSYFIERECHMEITTDVRLGCGLGTSAIASIILAKFFIENSRMLKEEYQYLTENSCLDASLTENKHLRGRKCPLNVKSVIHLPGIDYSYEKKMVCPGCIEAAYDCKRLTREQANIIDLARLDRRVMEVAFKIEDLFHGVTSGCDVAACYVTGLICYERYQYRKMDIGPLLSYKILIYDSKIPKTTKEVIMKCKGSERIIDEIKCIAEDAEKLLMSDFKLKNLYTLIRRNQELLEELGVVPEEMKKEVLRVRAMGYESKITGAGCGGHLFTIVAKKVIIDGWEEVEIYKK